VSKDLLLKDFNPTSQLVTKQFIVQQARFPVIDAHNHLSFDKWDYDERPVSQLIDTLDEANVRVYVDLDGGWGEDILNHHLDYFKAVAPERFLVYGGIEWNAWSTYENNFGEWAAKQFRKQVARGAEGLKVWKNFGLHVRDQNGDLVMIDDARLDPIWQAAGELNLPITIHIADPVAFFDPLDNTNERWDELHAHPDWRFPSPPYPSFMLLLNSFANLVRRHPQTIFIGAHVGCYAENLEWVGKLLDECPNFYVDISERIAELGRQPYSARRFFLKYADRILFGTDCPPTPEIYRLYYRFLETDDEYFDYGLTDIPRQGRWKIYGLYLPDDVLRKVYFENAQRILV